MVPLLSARSWRWFIVRVGGILSRDTPTATLVARRRRDPAHFESWLKAKAKRE